MTRSTRVPARRREVPALDADALTRGPDLHFARGGGACAVRPQRRRQEEELPSSFFDPSRDDDDTPMTGV